MSTWKVPRSRWSSPWRSARARERAAGVMAAARRARPRRPRDAAPRSIAATVCGLSIAAVLGLLIAAPSLAVRALIGFRRALAAGRHLVGDVVGGLGMHLLGTLRDDRVQRHVGVLSLAGCVVQSEDRVQIRLGLLGQLAHDTRLPGARGLPR